MLLKEFKNWTKWIFTTTCMLIKTLFRYYMFENAFQLQFSAKFLALYYEWHYDEMNMIMNMISKEHIKVFIGFRYLIAMQPVQLD